MIIGGQIRSVGLDHSPIVSDALDMAPEQELTTQAMSLPADQRAQLACRLILSLEAPDYDADADQLWEREIEQRLSAIDRGEVEPLEWRASLERARQSLRRKNSA
jgi:hypothetical protein